MKRILFALVAAIAVAVMAFLSIASAQEETTSQGDTNKEDTNSTASESSSTSDSSSAPSTQAANKFRLVRSQAAVANNCLPNARATVAIKTVGANQTMRVNLAGMPKKTDFTVFLLQIPNSPFGFSWYQGDVKTDKTGAGTDTFRGIFSDEVFGIALPPPVPAAHVDAFDAAFDSPFNPVHTFHMGVWFADPRDAAAAGCSNTVTPFDGDHIAGIQVLSTRNFGNNANTGPVRRTQ